MSVIRRDSYLDEFSFRYSENLTLVHGKGKYVSVSERFESWMAKL